MAQRENLTCPRSHTYKVVKPGLRSKCCCFSFCLPPNMAHSSATLGPATQFQPKADDFHFRLLYSSLDPCLQILNQMPYPGSLTFWTLLDALKIGTSSSAFVSSAKTRSDSGNVLSVQTPFARWYVCTYHACICLFLLPDHKGL